MNGKRCTKFDYIRLILFASLRVCPAEAALRRGTFAKASEEGWFAGKAVFI